ncbi:histidine kinase [Leptolyngbya sp. 'hensonii']|uniref:sensor histidine kinase n=1 Tax=Leptolyngbya sp. 'hensonii' TaxID=1922337 RepID=UPI00094FAD5C|nr:GAF domain-containing protein [Leptolyngbya sp. 'hensonii']OLP16857.1 histidine kinase [Leptolyngbya sp. 'hensonii']
MVQQKEPTVHEKQLVALGRTLQILREEQNVDALIETVLVYLQDEFDYSLVWLGLYDRVEHRLFGKGGMTPTGDTTFLKQRFVLAPGDLLEQVVIQQRPVAVPSLREETRAGEWRKAAQKFNVQGTLLFPIRHRDRCFGVALLGTNLWGTSPRAEEKARLSIILGELGAALYHIDMEWQREQAKRPDEPLLSLLDRLRALPNLTQRLEVVVEETHRFVSPSRTNIYWFERERRYFWRRVGNRQRSGGLGDVSSQASGITIQEVNAFYQALAADQVVSIGEAHSSLKADITGRLMQQIKARSLIASPILFQGELLGFLAVEGTEARIWQEEEKNYVRGAAQLVALVAPLAEMEETIQQVKMDQALTAEVSHAIYSDEDWRGTLQNCAEKLCERLKAERFLVLLYDKDHNKFEITHQSQPSNRRSINSPLDRINEVDWQMLERSQEPVGIENLDEDLRLLAWRNTFLELGIKSLIICHTTIGRPLEGLVILCHEATRSWSQSEREIIRVVSQQIGLILHQWQLQRQNEQQQKIQQTVQWSLKTIQQINQLDRLEAAALQHMAQILQVPTVALLSWAPGRPSGRVTVPVMANEQYAIRADASVSIHLDALAKLALQTDGILPLQVGDLSPETRYWIPGPAIGQLLVAPLRTGPEHVPTGIVIIVDQRDRLWTDRHLTALDILVSQLAWFRRYLTLTESLHIQQERLERLNWYKHGRLEETYRSLTIGLKRLNESLNQHQATLGNQPYQALRQISDALNPLALLLKDEQWRLRAYQETAPLAGFLKRALERVEGLIKQRQLWSQVHNNEGNLSLSGDIAKIELIVHEVLVAACYRCQPGGRLDIWCRLIDPRWLEISITDNGMIEPLLASELQSGRVADLLAPSTLDQPPGLHLLICQTLMKQMGSEFGIYKLDDGRILSRLVLPLATAQPPGRAAGYSSSG